MSELVQISNGQRVIRKQGSGPAMSICLVMTRDDGRGVGLGDHIQSLPVIYDLIARGFELTVIASGFYRSLYERAGCKFFDESQKLFMRDLLPRYGQVYGMIEWSIDDDNATLGNSTTDRVSLFASWFDLKRPNSFDYPSALGAKTDDAMRDLDLVIFAPQSSSIYRQFPREEYLYHRLKKTYPELLWLGSHRRQGERHIADFGTLTELVANATAVLATDNGIMHMASALGTPVFAVFGGTDESIVCEPYDLYNPADAAKRRYIRANPKHADCHYPCSFSESRGFHVDGKCKEFADCMMDIDTEYLLSSFNNFYSTIRSN